MRSFVAVVGVGLALAGPVVAQTCVPARFIFIADPMAGYVYLSNGNREGRATWTTVSSRMLNIDAIESVSTLTVGGDRGALIRTRTEDRRYGSATVSFHDYVFYWVPREAQSTIMTKIRCRSRTAASAASVAPKSAEQQEREEVRRWQMLRALEELDPADLL